MKVTAFNLHFKFEGGPIKATVQKFKPSGEHFMHYRVAVEGANEFFSIYNFYEIKDEDQPIAWYSLPESKQQFAKAIAKALKKYIVQN